ncbi:major capsid protein [Micromonospora tulbaghiae]|uniref:major capsid protein n=1 Tax=Micromonospora tulbaghiae TaxID=479978 RepID=UPI003319B5F6
MYLDEYITPAQLTSYAREVPMPAELILERFLPNRQINHIEAAIDEVTRTNRTAKFRSWDTPEHIGRRDQFESRKIKLPPLGQILPVGEYEQLQLALARTGGNDRAAMIEAIYDDTDNNVRSIYNRIELARGDVLQDGAFTLVNEEGLTLEADFGLEEDNDVAPAGELWSNHDEATPLTDMRPWMVHYARKNGSRPGYAVMSETVIADLAASKEVRQAAAGSATFMPPFVTDEALAAIFRQNRFPTIVPYDTMFDVDGVAKRVIDEGKVIFLPQNPSTLGFTAWGITAHALALTGSTNPQLAFSQAPGIVAVNIREGNPPRVHTLASAVCMPMITDPRKLMVATVR